MEKIIKRKELLHIVTKLHELLFTSSTQKSGDFKLAIKIVVAIDRWVTCEGHSGLSRAKAMQNFAIRHLMGTPIESFPLSNRYRRLISKALRECESTTVKIFWVSIFSVIRLYRLPVIVDVSTITSGFSGRLSGLLKWKYLSTLGIVKKSFTSMNFVEENWSATWKWHISGSSGPNGPLSYTQYLNDLRSLSHSWLLIGLVFLFVTLPYDNKRETVKALRNAFLDSLQKGEQNSIHSKLVFLSDKGGKTRVVAIGDILSQSILNTVHQRCNLVLRRLSQDGTFDQDSARLYIKKMSRDSVPLASIDLTAVTDRMPVLFQVWVIVHLRILTPLQALGWWWVTTRRTFVFNDGNVLKRVRYKVGQPMGLLSSWPVMAISHHYLVRWSFAAHGWKRPGKAPYRVLGDDLALRGFGVAEVYLDLISCLGMEYNPDKTYISRGVAEFAKSLFCQGVELTPIPLALLRFNKNTIVSNTLAIISELKRRNLPLRASTLVGLYPKRWCNLVLLAALSPSSPKYGLDLQTRLDYWVFLQFVYARRIRYFSRLATVRDSTHAFAFSDPGSSGLWLSSPFLQIARDNGESYPVRYLKDNKRLLNPEVLIGSGWISYCSSCWPNGLPPLDDRNLIPGTSWERERDDKIYRSSLLDLNKLLPDYFTVRCVGKQVGE